MTFPMTSSKVRLAGLALAVLLGCPFPPAHAADTDEGVVTVSADWQRLSGIELIRTAGAQLAEQWPGTGAVVDLRPLLEQAGRLHEAQADLEIARAALKGSSGAQQRLAMLKREADNVSARQTQEAEAQRSADAAKVRAAELRLRD